MDAGWLDLDNIKKLKKLVLDPDFNVQSDALETMRVSKIIFHVFICLGTFHFERQI